MKQEFNDSFSLWLSYAVFLSLKCFFFDCALGLWHMFYSTVQLLQERRVVGVPTAQHSLIIPCWVMERTVCSGLNKSSWNVFQTQGQNNDLAFAFVWKGAWAACVIFIRLIVNLLREREKKNRQPNEEMVATIGDQLDIKIIT